MILFTLNLLVSTVWAAVNNFSHIETKRYVFIEKYIPCYPLDPTDYQHNPYNKGVLANISDIIGPTILHWLFPLPKLTKGIPEQGGSYKKIREVTSLEQKQYLVSINNPNIYRVLEVEQIENKPEMFIQNAFKYYGNKLIIE